MIFICFDLFWFDSNLRRIRFIELSNELAAPILNRFQNFFGFCVFYISSFKFWVRRLVSLRWRTVYSLLLEENWSVCIFNGAFSKEKRAFLITSWDCVSLRYNHLSKDKIGLPIYSSVENQIIYQWPAFLPSRKKKILLRYDFVQFCWLWALLNAKVLKCLFLFFLVWNQVQNLFHREQIMFQREQEMLANKICFKSSKKC